MQQSPCNGEAMTSPSLHRGTIQSDASRRPETVRLQRAPRTEPTGTLTVHVLGSSIPRTLHSRLPLTILCSILRCLLLTFLLICCVYLPGPASPINPIHPLERFDVFIVDQQSVCVPFLRYFAGTRVVFYCHFPDKLLSGGWKFGEGHVERSGGSDAVGVLKKLYRWPFDKLEELTTGTLSAGAFPKDRYLMA